FDECGRLMIFKVETRNVLVKALPSDESGIWVEKTSLVREDGVCLEKIGDGRDGECYFRYSDQDVSFELIAYDFDNDRRSTDTWVVSLGGALKQYSPSEHGPVDLAKAREIARNIEEALKAWPRYPSEPAIRQVKFLMKFWPLWNPALGD